MVPSGIGPLGRSAAFLLSIVCGSWLILKWLRAHRGLRQGASLVEAFGSRVRLVDLFGVLVLAVTLILVAALVREP